MRGLVQLGGLTNGRRLGGPGSNPDPELDGPGDGQRAGSAAILPDGPGYQTGGEDDGGKAGGVEVTTACERREAREGRDENGGKSGFYGKSWLML